MIEHPMVRFKGKKLNHAWCRWMCNRTMRKNQNNLIMIKGKTGTGKTYTGLSCAEICEKIDKVPFTIDHVVFSLKELLELINSDKVKKGSKIIFDEPQISISAREFQSKANKIFNSLATTFRHKNYTLFFCAPFEGLLDKNTRKLFHAVFETMSIDRKRMTCRVKPRAIEYKDTREKPFYPRLYYQVDLGNGESTGDFLDSWDVPSPSKELIEQYEEKKLRFTTDLNKKLYDELIEFETKKENSIYKITKRQREVIDCMLKHADESLVESEIKNAVAEELNVKIQSINDVLNTLESNGKPWTSFLEKLQAE